MNRLVLDTLAAVSWLFEDEAGQQGVHLCRILAILTDGETMIPYLQPLELRMCSW